MYTHLGNGRMLRTRDILGIFDMDTATMGSATRELLKSAERDGRLESVGDDIPKSIVLTRDARVLVTQLSASALCGRADMLYGLE